MGESENKSNWSFGLVEIFIFLLIAGFCIAVIIPNFAGSHSNPAAACINNLRQIDGAANEFALLHHLTNGDAINYPADLTPYIETISGPPPGHWTIRKTVLNYPSGGTYSISKVGENPICSLGTTVTPAHVLP